MQCAKHCPLASFIHKGRYKNVTKQTPFLLVCIKPYPPRPHPPVANICKVNVMNVDCKSHHFYY